MLGVVSLEGIYYGRCEGGSSSLVLGVVSLAGIYILWSVRRGVIVTCAVVRGHIYIMVGAKGGHRHLC